MGASTTSKRLAKPIPSPLSLPSSWLPGGESGDCKERGDGTRAGEGSSEGQAPRVFVVYKQS
jgi:hypothetical protein